MLRGCLLLRHLQRSGLVLAHLLISFGLINEALADVSPEALLTNAFEAQVDQDFIDVRTGPGRAYPVHQIVQQDDWLHLVKQKTNWIYIESEKGVNGWLHSSALPHLKTREGKAYNAGVTDAQPVIDYFEFGLNVGDFGGSQLLAGYGGYAFTPQIMLEATLGQAIGSFSTTSIVGGQVMHLAKPWKGFTPYGALGAGRVFVKASSRIRQPEDQDDDYLKAAMGMRIHIDGRFFMKFEYGSYLVLRSQDENDEINEWKLGISAVF